MSVSGATCHLTEHCYSLAGGLRSLVMMLHTPLPLKPMPQRQTVIRNAELALSAQKAMS